MTDHTSYQTLAPTRADDQREEDWETLCEAKEDEIWLQIAKDGGRQFVKDYDAEGDLEVAFNLINAFVESVAKGELEK